MARKKKTKAQREYERIRKNVMQYKRRHKGDYIVPHTPAQELRGNITAKDYRLYTKELKQFYQNIKQLDKEKKERQQEEFIEYADVIIYNFKSLFNISTEKEAKGRDFILEWIEQLISTHGKLAVALMLTEAEQSTTLAFTAEVLYDLNSANLYTQGLQKFLKDSGMSKSDLARIQTSAEENEP